MTFNTAKLLRNLVIAVFAVSWAILAYLSSINASNAGVALALLPLFAIAGIFLWRAKNSLWIASGISALIGLTLFLWPILLKNIALIYLLQHVGINLALGSFFGRTLFGKKEALVTQFSRLIHNGTISDREASYTRKVTIAWTWFFLLIAILSIGLYLFAPISIWSLFANLLTLPLIISMFLGEYICRCYAFPREERTSIKDAWRAYRLSMEQRNNSVAKRA